MPENEAIKPQPTIHVGDNADKKILIDVYMKMCEEDGDAPTDVKDIKEFTISCMQKLLQRANLTDRYTEKWCLDWMNAQKSSRNTLLKIAIRNRNK